MGVRTLVMGLGADQVSSRSVCKLLRDVLRAAVESGPDAAGGIDSIPCRASATLYGLLLDHPVDRRGRCRSCQRPSLVPGLRRRVCRVHIKADYWLHQPAALLHSLLARELGLTYLPPAQDSPTQRPSHPKDFEKSGETPTDDDGNDD